MKTIYKTFLILVFLGGIKPMYAQTVYNAKKNTTAVRNVRANDFYQAIKRTENPQIIDIRTPQEYRQGHIKGAILTNFYDRLFAQNIANANLNTSKPIFVYCRSGNRSSHAIPIFQKLGFKHIIHLVYGINDWKASQLPLEN